MVKRIFTVLLATVAFVCIWTVPVSAEETYVYDDADLFDSTEEQILNEELKRVSQSTGWTVVVATTVDIGSDKSDYAATDYADMYFETRYGKESDGILYLINNDTKYDRISTSGVCIEYFTDSRIEMVFDYIWDDMVDERFFSAMLDFGNRVEYYYHSGIPAGQYTTEDYYYDDGEIVFTDNTLGDFLEVVLALFPGILIFFAVIGFILFAIYKSILNGYKMKPSVAANPYIAPNSLNVKISSDDYVKEYTTRTRIASSSSGGHRSSGRSSSHRSSGGGRHGGGGRRR